MASPGGPTAPSTPTGGWWSTVRFGGRRWPLTSRARGSTSRSRFRDAGDEAAPHVGRTGAAGRSGSVEQPVSAVLIHAFAAPRLLVRGVRAPVGSGLALHR